MVHIIGRGIKKYAPFKLIGLDFKEGEYQLMDLYPERRVLVIHSSHYKEPEQVLDVVKLKGDVK